MFITIKKVMFSNPRANKGFIKMEALKKLALCELTGTDIQIDNYCREHYKKPLKSVCKYLIQKSFIQYNSYTNEYIVLYNDPELDKMASAITYGTGAILGSNILVDCFGGRR